MEFNKNKLIIQFHIVISAVQHERGPRHSTLKRQQQQMVQLLNETSPKLMGTQSSSVLDLAMSTSPVTPPRFQTPLNLTAASFFTTPASALTRVSCL